MDFNRRVKKGFNPQEKRDDHGRWTAGGTSQAEPPASTSRSIDWEKIMGNLNGPSLIPVKKQDLPPRLYHATTNIDGILDSGHLRPNSGYDKGGLGSPNWRGRVISLTDDADIAEHLAREFKRVVQIARGEIDIENGGLHQIAREDAIRLGLPENALNGAADYTLDDFYKPNLAPLKRMGHMETEEDRRKFQVEAYTGAWQHARSDGLRRAKIKPLPFPGFYGKYEAYRDADPSNIGVVAVDTDSIPDAADLNLGTDFHLHEIRSQGEHNIPVAGRRVEKSFNPSQARDEKGRWSKSSGLTRRIFDAAKEHYGITDDPRESGWLLPDGTMLDLSGRHRAEQNMKRINGRNVPTNEDVYAGSRRVEHATINDAYNRAGLFTGGFLREHGSPYFDFMRRGAIRMHYKVDDYGDGSDPAKWLSLNFSSVPTDSQMAVLRDLTSDSVNIDTLDRTTNERVADFRNAGYDEHGKPIRENGQRTLQRAIASLRASSTGAELRAQVNKAVSFDPNQPRASNGRWVRVGDKSPAKETAGESAPVGRFTPDYNKKLHDAAKKVFGVTHNPLEAGYLLPDGTMLDFSGRSDAGYIRQGERFVPKMGRRDEFAGRRQLDHSDVSRAYSEADVLAPQMERTHRNSMYDFLGTGAIRMSFQDDDANPHNKSGYYFTAHLGAVPTEEQMKAMKDMAHGAVTIDLSDASTAEHLGDFTDEEKAGGGKLALIRAYNKAKDMFSTRKSLLRLALEKMNTNHDKATGRFTHRPGGALEGRADNGRTMVRAVATPEMRAAGVVAKISRQDFGGGYYVHFKKQGSPSIMFGTAKNNDVSWESDGKKLTERQATNFFKKNFGLTKTPDVAKLLDAAEHPDKSREPEFTSVTEHGNMSATANGTLKDGTPVTIVSRADGDALQISAFDEAGQQIGGVNFSETDSKKYAGWILQVNEEYRRLGVASLMYNLADKVSGGKIKQSEEGDWHGTSYGGTTVMGTAFWDGRRKKMSKGNPNHDDKGRFARAASPSAQKVPDAAAPEPQAQASADYDPVKGWSSQVRRKLTAEATKHFGVTSDPREAGFITEERGALLDLSGKHNSDDYEKVEKPPRKGLDGQPIKESVPLFENRLKPGAKNYGEFDRQRLTDHSEAGYIMELAGVALPDGYKDDLYAFMEATNSVRISYNGETLNIDLASMPSPSQLNKLSNLAGDELGVTWDITNPKTGGNIASGDGDGKRAIIAMRRAAEKHFIENASPERKAYWKQRDREFAKSERQRKALALREQVAKSVGA